ncbi:MAG: glycosyltransferase [Candidatus Dormibacteria bacterium]
MAADHPSKAAAPWLSVVMPTYNGAAYVGAALASIAAEVRGRSDIEVIVVDDGSDDGTCEVAERLLPTGASRVISSGGRRGWAAATNIGMARAAGRWLCMLHQDDVWIPGRLDAVERAIRSEPDAGLVVGATRFIDEFGRALGMWHLPWREDVPSPAELARRLYVQNWLGLPSATFRADIAGSVGPLDATLWYAADWDLWLRMIRAARVVVAEGALSGFRVHPASQTHIGSARTDDFRNQMTSVQERHRWAAGGDPSVLRAGAAATAVNVCLASLLHGQQIRWWELAAPMLRLRVSGWHRFVRDSRIRERAVPRVRLAARSRLRRIR